ncbi:hypothetical protein INR49_028018 [Caranx melampygus]|nr:hypothetical protein INR49_028018 [Caranx melampygus]
MEAELKLDSQFMNRSAKNKPSIVQNRPTIQKNTHLIPVGLISVKAENACCLSGIVCFLPAWAHKFKLEWGDVVYYTIIVE